MKGNIQITVDTDWANLDEVFRIHNALTEAGWVINNSGCMQGVPTLSYDMTISSWNPLVAKNTGLMKATDELHKIIEAHVPRDLGEQQ